MKLRQLINESSLDVYYTDEIQRAIYDWVEMTDVDNLDKTAKTLQRINFPIELKSNGPFYRAMWISKAEFKELSKGKSDFQSTNQIFTSYSRSLRGAESAINSDWAYDSTKPALIYVKKDNLDVILDLYLYLKNSPKKSLIRELSDVIMDEREVIVKNEQIKNSDIIAFRATWIDDYAEYAWQDVLKFLKGQSVKRVKI